MSRPHKNDERTVRCPVDGCDETVLARGIHLHVRQSAGDGHGPHGDVPDHITFDDLETVGSEAVEIDYPEERDNEQVARLCPYCSEVFTGKEGVRIHLGQVEGRKNHPQDANEHHDPEDFPRVAIDDDGNVVDVLPGRTDRKSTEPAKSHIPVTNAYQYIATLLAEDRHDEARLARAHLFDTGGEGSESVRGLPSSLSEALEGVSSDEERR